LTDLGSIFNMSDLKMLSMVTRRVRHVRVRAGWNIDLERVLTVEVYCELSVAVQEREDDVVTCSG
jgi:hypothetical protein